VNNRPDFSSERLPSSTNPQFCAGNKNLVFGPRWGLDTKTDRRLQHDFVDVTFKRRMTKRHMYRDFVDVTFKRRMTKRHMYRDLFPIQKWALKYKY
jgi:hypothetical protein